MAEEVILMTLTDSGYRRHMEKVRLRLADEMVKIVSKLRAIGIEPWLIPQAGMFLWCSLPEGIDATIIARACLEEGVILAPGNAFSQSLSALGFLRFNVAQCADDRIFEILKKVLLEYNTNHSLLI